MGDDKKLFGLEQMTVGDNDYVVFTQKSLFDLLRDLEITVGSRVEDPIGAEVIMAKIEEHRVPFAGILLYRT